jgi:precorrin-8X/cobalt-precorrin-8 methylmutase
MDTAFDAYISVDWSASARPGPQKPKQDALWMAWGEMNGVHEVKYFPTRGQLMRTLRELVLQYFHSGKRILAGFDFGFGYPAGFADACDLPGEGAPWERTWAWISRAYCEGEDRFLVAEDLNQRCGSAIPQGPFWGLPVKAEDRPYLTRKRSGFSYPYPIDAQRQLRRLRHTDAGTKGVQELWKLYGVGSVGSQTITGIAHLERLRQHEDIRDHCQVWPFETGFALPQGAAATLVLAECFPGMVNLVQEELVVEEIDKNGREIKDRRQVRSVVHHLMELDRRGELGSRFAAPENLSPEAVADCLREEAYILPI